MVAFGRFRDVGQRPADKARRPQLDVLMALIEASRGVVCKDEHWSRVLAAGSSDENRQSGKRLRRCTKALVVRT
jgi:hypothetical protein